MMLTMLMMPMPAASSTKAESYPGVVAVTRLIVTDIPVAASVMVMSMPSASHVAVIVTPYVVKDNDLSATFLLITGPQ